MFFFFQFLFNIRALVFSLRLHALLPTKIELNRAHHKKKADQGTSLGRTYMHLPPKPQGAHILFFFFFNKYAFAGESAAINFQPRQVLCLEVQIKTHTGVLILTGVSGHIMKLPCTALCVKCM